MARTPSTKSADKKNNSWKKDYDGYLNLKLVDKLGNEHNIKCFIGLEADNKVHRALLNKADGQDFDLKGYVKLAEKDDGNDIDF